MPKFKDTYLIESSRLKTWDYTNPWWYYITIATKDHLQFLGEVKRSKMILNELGAIVETEWLKTKELRTNVDLDYYVVMPNHFNGIIILKEPVETCHSKSLRIPMEAEFGKPVKNSLSVIVNQFKGAVTRQAKLNGHINFSWQPRFYDRIIRNEKELYDIRRYIELNPFKWSLEEDDENIDCLD